MDSNKAFVPLEPTKSVHDVPLVLFVQQILDEAIKQGASDIHFESYEQEYRIRYRQDGILHTVAKPPPHLANRIRARIKVLAQLDIAEKRLPQDGGFKLNLPQTQNINFRVSTCPSAEGEKVVIRILDSDPKQRNLDHLGLSELQKNQFIQALKKPQGLILVTGPTGSGKTLSLYTALNILNTEEVNILSVEDPIEIKLPGINQVNIHEKSGLSFSEVLRCFLRQDPDIIMLGEIRDAETAEIALNAAQTGHLVLSTLHTNSAAETLNRLSALGIPSFNIASALSMIMSQRLLRKLCEQCKIPREDLSPFDLLKLGFKESELTKLHLFKAQGCQHCRKGYMGRTGLFEVLNMTKTMKQLILSKANSEAILELAKKEGMHTLYQSGLEKVREGCTSIEEVLRVSVAV